MYIDKIIQPKFSHLTLSFLLILVTVFISACVSTQEPNLELYELQTERVDKTLFKSFEPTRGVLPAQTVGRCGASVGLNCSAPDSLSISIRGFGPGRGLNTQFRETCNKHDFCYRHGAFFKNAISKEECDEQLNQNIKSLCTLINRGNFVQMCESRGWAAYIGVYLGGKSSYRSNVKKSKNNLQSTFCNYDQDTSNLEFIKKINNMGKAFNNNDIDFNRRPLLFDITFGEPKPLMRLGVSLISPKELIKKVKDDGPCKTSAIKFVSYKKGSQKKEHYFWCGLGKQYNDQNVIARDPRVKASIFHSKERDVVLISYVSDTEYPLNNPPLKKTSLERLNCVLDTEINKCPGLVLRTFTIEKNNPSDITEKSWLLWRKTEIYKFGLYQPIISDFNGDNQPDILVYFRSKEEEKLLKLVPIMSRQDGSLILSEETNNNGFSLEVSDLYHPFKAVPSQDKRSLIFASIGNVKGLLSMVRFQISAGGIVTSAPSSSNGISKPQVTTCDGGEKCSIAGETLLPVIDAFSEQFSSRLILPSRENMKIKFRIYKTKESDVNINKPEKIITCINLGRNFRVSKYGVDKEELTITIGNGKQSIDLIYDENKNFRLVGESANCN